MATALDIANRALTLIGGRTILSLTEGNKEARLCNDSFDSCRAAVLRAYPAKFSITRDTLTITEEAPKFGYANSFELPDNFIRLISLNEGDESYEIEGGFILSDSSELRIRYVWDFKGPNYPDPIWNEALAIYLAWSISYALTQSGELRDRLWQDYTQVMKMARWANATEGAAKQVSAEQRLDARMNRGRYPSDPGT